MRAFIMGAVAVIVIAITAAVILNTMNMTTAEMFTSTDVRL